MTLKADWVDGDTFAAADANAVAEQVNTNTTDITGKQAADTDLTAIAALTPTNDDVLQRKAGAWTNRTPAQLKTDLALTASDVGLGNVTNNAQYFAGGTDVAVADGGTGASTASGARTNLGVAYGTTAGTVCEGNDSRLSDTRTPTDNSVTSAKIVNGAITNDDINASAAIALSKLATGRVAGSNNGTATNLTLWIGTAAQYAAIGSKDSSTVYIVTA